MASANLSREGLQKALADPKMRGELHWWKKFEGMEQLWRSAFIYEVSARSRATLRRNPSITWIIEGIDGVGFEGPWATLSDELKRLVWEHYRGWTMTGFRLGDIPAEEKRFGVDFRNTVGRSTLKLDLLESISKDVSQQFKDDIQKGREAIEILNALADKIGDRSAAMPAKMIVDRSGLTSPALDFSLNLALQDAELVLHLLGLIVQLRQMTGMKQPAGVYDFGIERIRELIEEERDHGQGRSLDDRPYYNLLDFFAIIEKFDDALAKGTKWKFEREKKRLRTAVSWAIHTPRTHYPRINQDGAAVTYQPEEGRITNALIRRTVEVPRERVDDATPAKTAKLPAKKRRKRER